MIFMVECGVLAFTRGFNIECEVGYRRGQGGFFKSKFKKLKFLGSKHYKKTRRILLI